LRTRNRRWQRGRRQRHSVAGLPADGHGDWVPWLPVRHCSSGREVVVLCWEAAGRVRCAVVRGPCGGGQQRNGQHMQSWMFVATIAACGGHSLWGTSSGPCWGCGGQLPDPEQGVPVTAESAAPLRLRQDALPGAAGMRSSRGGAHMQASAELTAWLRGVGCFQRPPTQLLHLPLFAAR